MFEAITQTQPDDYQSLEILKEAYSKVGKTEEALKVSRRLAEAYFNVGSYTLAMQECEAILVKEANAPDILAMLGDIEARLQASGHALAARHANTASGGNRDGSLIQVAGGKRAPELTDRGDEHLAKFLIVQQLFGEEDVKTAIEVVGRSNKDLSGQALAASLLDHL